MLVVPVNRPGRGGVAGHYHGWGGGRGGVAGGRVGGGVQHHRGGSGGVGVVVTRQDGGALAGDVIHEMLKYVKYVYLYF